jgi:hypothetical protein
MRGHRLDLTRSTMRSTSSLTNGNTATAIPTGGTITFQTQFQSREPWHYSAVEYSGWQDSPGESCGNHRISVKSFVTSWCDLTRRSLKGFGAFSLARVLVGLADSARIWPVSDRNRFFSFPILGSSRLGTPRRIAAKSQRQKWMHVTILFINHFANDFR